MMISSQKQGLIKGGYARPAHTLLSLIGTRPEIFQFNEFNQIRSLIELVNLDGDTSQSQENPAGNSSSFDSVPVSF